MIFCLQCSKPVAYAPANKSGNCVSVRELRSNLFQHLPPSHFVHSRRLIMFVIYFLRSGSRSLVRFIFFWKIRTQRTAIRSIRMTIHAFTSILNLEGTWTKSTLKKRLIGEFEELRILNQGPIDHHQVFFC